MKHFIHIFIDFQALSYGHREIFNFDLSPFEEFANKNGIPFCYSICFENYTTFHSIDFHNKIDSNFLQEQLLNNIRSTCKDEKIKYEDILFFSRSPSTQLIFWYFYSMFINISKITKKFLDAKDREKSYRDNRYFPYIKKLLRDNISQNEESKKIRRLINEIRNGEFASISCYFLFSKFCKTKSEFINFNFDYDKVKQEIKEYSNSSVKKIFEIVKNQ